MLNNTVADFYYYTFSIGFQSHIQFLRMIFSLLFLLLLYRFNSKPAVQINTSSLSAIQVIRTLNYCADLCLPFSATGTMISTARALTRNLE